MGITVNRALLFWMKALSFAWMYLSSLVISISLMEILSSADRMKSSKIETEGNNHLHTNLWK